MVHENEIVMFFICIGVLIFAFLNRERLVKFKKWKLLFSSFILLLIACGATVLEEFFFNNLLNYIEHICYAGSGVVLALWCQKIFRGSSS